MAENLKDLQAMIIPTMITTILIQIGTAQLPIIISIFSTILTRWINDTAENIIAVINKNDFKFIILLTFSVNP